MTVRFVRRVAATTALLAVIAISSVGGASATTVGETNRMWTRRTSRVCS